MKNLLDVYNSVNHFGTENNMTYKVIEEGEIEYEMSIENKHLATAKAAHGGLIAAFMDAIIGVAALSSVYQENKVVATIEFKINYYAPAFFGDKLKGIGKVDKKGKRLIFTTGEIYNQHNELIAKATGTLNAYDFDKSDMANI